MTVKPVEELGRIREMAKGFPGSVFNRPTFPVDQVLKLASIVTRVQNFFHFVLIGTVNFNRRWRVLGAAWNIVRVKGLQETHVKYGVDLHACGQP